MWFERLANLGHRISLVAFWMAVALCLGCLFSANNSCYARAGAFPSEVLGMFVFAVVVCGAALLAVTRGLENGQVEFYAKQISSGLYDDMVLSRVVPINLAHLMFGVPLLIFPIVPLAAVGFLGLSLFMELRGCG